MSNTNNAAIFRWLAFITASLFFLYEFLARIEPSLAATDISRFLGLSNTGFGMLVSLFFWIYAPLQLVVCLATNPNALSLCLLACALLALLVREERHPDPISAVKTTPDGDLHV